MSKYERMFEGNVDFNGVEGTYQTDFLARVAAAGDSKEEMIDVLKDLNVVISKSMNDTIDAAKNGAKVRVPYMDSFRVKYRSGAVATKDYAAIKLLPGQLKLAPLKLSIRGQEEVPAKQRSEIFRRPVKREKKGKNNVWVAEDLLTAVRNETAVYAYQQLQEKLQDKIDEEIKSYQTADVPLYNSLKFLAESYDAAMHIDGGDKKAMKKAIVQMSRNLIRNNSRADSRNLFQEAYLASCYTDKKTNSVRTNSYYMALTHEATKYFVDRYNPEGVFENRIYKFGGGKAKVGQRITFVKGISEDGFYAETPVNGTYTLEINNELQAVIRRPVQDMIPEAEYDDKVVFMELIPRNHTHEETVELLEKARAAKAPFTVRYVQTAGSNRDNLWLIAGTTLIAELRNPSNKGGRSRYEQFLAGKHIMPEQVEILLPTKADRLKRIFVTGHII